MILGAGGLGTFGTFGILGTAGVVRELFKVEAPLSWDLIGGFKLNDAERLVVLFIFGDGLFLLLLLFLIL